MTIRTPLSKRSLCVGIMGLTLISSCDWLRKNKCEWYLVPEPDHAKTVEPGWVALCARNYVNNKQRCRLKAKMEFSKKVFGKPFRYSSLNVKEGTYPKEVLSVELCEK